MPSFVDPLPGLREAVFKRLAPRPNGTTPAPDAYEYRVFKRAFDLSSAIEELEHLPAVLQSARTFPQIVVLLKLYVVGWVSLSDILANLINEAFDLGYAEQDIQFNVILRNRKVVTSQLAAIVSRHRKTTDYDRFARLRNDVVHRGTFEDPDVRALRNDYTVAVVKRAVQLGIENPTNQSIAESQVGSEMRIHDRIAELLARKSSELSVHLEATRVLLKDLAPAIVERVAAQPAS